MDVVEVMERLCAAQEEVLGADRRAMMDAAALDRNLAQIRETFEGLGVDYDEVRSVVGTMSRGYFQAMANDPVRALGDPTFMPMLMQSALIQVMLVGLHVGAGVMPSPVEAPPTYREHPEVTAGGWIRNDGVLVRVLGIDPYGRVADEVDGELTPSPDRHSPECWLEWHTRVDDVPILGDTGS